LKLKEQVHTLCKGLNHAVLTTLAADGSPQSQVMWVDCDDDHVIVNTETHRQKFKNISRDPRVVILIPDAGNPHCYAEIRGRVVEVITGSEARSHINVMAKKYLDLDDYPLDVESERAILKIAPDRQLLVDVG
jgi:PPOX class probable F420-dependent enzyme